jgi:hypothetical protein
VFQRKKKRKTEHEPQEEVAFEEAVDLLRPVQELLGKYPLQSLAVEELKEEVEPANLSIDSAQVLSLSQATTLSALLLVFSSPFPGDLFLSQGHFSLTQRQADVAEDFGKSEKEKW